MGGKKAAAMLPEPGPDLLAIGLGDFQRGQRRPREKLKPSFGVWRRQYFQLRLEFEQKHQPVRLTLVAVFTDQAGQMQIGGPDFDSQFLSCLAAGTDVRRFTNVHL